MCLVLVQLNTSLCIFLYSLSYRLVTKCGIVSYTYYQQHILLLRFSHISHMISWLNIVTLTGIHTSNCSSNPVIPFPEISLLSLAVLEIMSCALNDVSPHVISSSRASCTNMYCAYRQNTRWCTNTCMHVLCVSMLTSVWTMKTRFIRMLWTNSYTLTFFVCDIRCNIVSKVM